MKRYKRTGIVLITTMMSICIVVMMLNVFLQSGTLNLMRSSTFYDREAALQAAQSGLEYAVTKLQADNYWRGDSNVVYSHKEDVADVYAPSCFVGSLSDGLLVAESNGNVIGVMRNRDGVVSAFRIKFSYEDDSDDTWDKVPCNRFGTKDKKEISSFNIAIPYVSVNNLDGSKSVPVYRANANGKGIAESASSLEGRTATEVISHLPLHRVCMIVEGLSGKGLRDVADKGDSDKIVEAVNEAANESSALTRRYVEAYYSSNMPVFCGNAVTAKKDMNFHLAGAENRMFVDTACTDEGDEESGSLSTVPLAGSLSCGGAFSVNKGKLNTFDGKVLSNGTSSFENDGDDYWFLNDEGTETKYNFFTNQEEISSYDAEVITYNQVAHATTDDKRLSPGFYQWNLAEGATSAGPYYELRYYPDGGEVDDDGHMRPNDATNYQIAKVGALTAAEAEVAAGSQGSGSGTATTHSKCSLGPAEQLSFVTDASGRILEPTLRLSGNLYCEGDFIISSNVDTVKDVPQMVFVSRDVKVTNSSGATEEVTEGANLTATGNITIYACVSGQGALVTNGKEGEEDTTGKITVAGQSILDASSSSVAIFANNVELKALNQVVRYDATTDSDGSGGAIRTGSAFGPGHYGGFDRDWKDEIIKFFIGHHTYNKLIASGRCLDPILEKLNDGKKAAGNIKEYFATMYGAEVTVGDMKNKREEQFVEIEFSDDSRYRLRYKAHGHGSGYTIKCIDGDCSGLYFSCIDIPKDALVSGRGDDTYGNSDVDLKKCGNLFDTLCYGDQYYGGVIYAKYNFKADLGDQCNLVVDGAIRAAGSRDIDYGVYANCKDILITYDESCLKFLVPEYSKVSRLMWTCW